MYKLINKNGKVWGCGYDLQMIRTFFIDKKAGQKGYKIGIPNYVTPFTFSEFNSIINYEQKHKI